MAFSNSPRIAGVLRQIRISSLVVPWLLGLAACSSVGREHKVGGNGVTSDGGGADAAPADSLDPVTAPAPGQWAPLIAHSWKLDANTEGYWCKRVTVAEDIWVTGFRATRTPGIHHVTLGVDQGEPGAFRCTGFSLGNDLMFGTGQGGGEFTFPEGVAVKISAGQSLLLNLHLFNTTESPIAETSSIDIMAVDAANVQHEAALVLAGTMALSIPPGQVSTSHGGCAVTADTTLVGVGPHMHTHGIHEKVAVVTAAGDSTVLMDEPYDFGDQHYRPLGPPVLLPAGGHVAVDCTYQNDTASTLTFGESTNDEMCFAGLYHYPRMANGTTCTQ